MPVYNPEYSNANKVPLSLTGSKSYIIDEAHFTEQDCNITADGTLNVCCPVNFKDGFVFDGDICDHNGGATFRDFTATQGYYLEDSSSTCATSAGRISALRYFKDMTVPAAPVLSTVLECGTPLATGGGYIVVNNPQSQPFANPDNQGVQVIGGDNAYTQKM